MISIVQAIILGLTQGLTELFPISSLGHSVIIPSLFGWHINQSDKYFVTFLVATHFATALVLFFFFIKEWIKIIKGIFRSLADREIAPGDTYAKLGWLLVVGTIPAGILGLLFQDSFTKLFALPKVAASLLVVNGIILYGAERLRKKSGSRNETNKQSDANIAKLSWTKSIGVGIFQSAALFPGISRSGTSMAGGLTAGLNNEDALRFSFLLATPIIFAASLAKLPSLFSASAAPVRGAIFVGAISAAIAAYLSVKFLVKYFKTKTLTPFAIYCAIGGMVYLAYFLTK